MSDALQDLIDIGVNLSGRSFHKDTAEIIERAQQWGVTQMLVTGTDLQHSRAAVELSGQYQGVLYATSGVHPHHASEWTPQLAQDIHQLALQPEVKALGECGLDYNRNFSAPNAQRSCFESQLELAADLQLPVFLHQRDAHKDFFAILARWRDKLPGGVVHCFTGSEDEAKAYLDLDMYIGITGWLCDERRGQSLQQAVKSIPLDHLMLETDAPYLLPRNLPELLSKQLQERRNEPMVLSHICQALANYKDESAHTIARCTTQNSRKCFNIAA